MPPALKPWERKAVSFKKLDIKIALEQNSYEDAYLMLKDFERWLRNINESAADSLL